MDTTERDEWVARFVARLRNLRGSLPVDEAKDVALIAFETAGDLTPEDAAVVFGEILDAKVPIHDLRRWTRSKKAPR